MSDPVMLSKTELAALRVLDTPTVCNALEVVAPNRRGVGYTTETLVCACPHLSPMVGYARTYQPYLEECLGNNASIAIVNMPGAGGKLGFAALLNAAPDGYTLGYLNMPNMATATITKDPPWTIDSYTYIANVIGSKVTLNVPLTSDIETVKDLVDFGKEPGPITVSISGIGGDDHLMALRFAKAAGIEFNFIPFGDGASSRAALMGGHVRVGSMSNSEAANYQDKFRILGVMDKERSSFLPAGFLSRHRFSRGWSAGS